MSNSLRRETVFVVDDDREMRGALADLLSAAGHRVQTFETAVIAREAAFSAPPGCIVLDVRMPGLGGLDLQTELRCLEIPIIFITGQADVRMGVDAMKAGAFEFLTKPFRAQEIIDSVAQALSIEIKNQPLREEKRKIIECFSLLNEREILILSKVVAGKITKTIAKDLSLSEISIKKTRANIMRKMGAATLAQLVRYADKLNLNEESA